MSLRGQVHLGNSRANRACSQVLHNLPNLDFQNLRNSADLREKYPEYEGGEQQTYGVAEIHTLPTYRIGTPKRELLEAMKIIKDAGGRIQKKKMAEEAEKRKIIIVNAKEQNFTQARFASLDKNIVQPLVETWGFVEVGKIGRNRWLKMTEDGDHAAEFLI